MAEKKHSSARELIDTGRDKRYVRRDDKGRFDEVDEQSRSLSQDVRKHAQNLATLWGDPAAVKLLMAKMLDEKMPMDERILNLKRGLSALRRIVGPQRDTVLALTRDEFRAIPPEVRPYLRDVYDRLARSIAATRSCGRSASSIPQA